MSSRFSMMKSIVVAAALVAGASGMAHADDGSTNPPTGDSYAYFRLGEPIADSATSASPQSATNGLSQREIQALPSESPIFQVPSQPKASSPASTDASSWRQSHPHGLWFANTRHCRPSRPCGNCRISRRAMRSVRPMSLQLRRNAPNEPLGATSSK